MKVGILAGRGNLPSLAAQKLEQENKSYLFFSLISPDHAKELRQKHPRAFDALYLNRYHVEVALDLLIKQKITHVFFVGKVEKNSIFSLAKFDRLGLNILFSLGIQSDTSILSALERLLNQHNIQLISQKNLLSRLIIPGGFQEGFLTDQEQKEIAFGIQKAKVISEQEIGQTVIIKNRVIVAVEGAEGTNACIKRAYDLAGPELIICKANALADQKADLPTIGPETLLVVPPGGIKILAWQADTTLVVDIETCIKYAQRHAIILYAY